MVKLLYDYLPTYAVIYLFLEVNYSFRTESHYVFGLINSINASEKAILQLGLSRGLTKKKSVKIIN
jgi:hypothetical protein